MTLTALAAFVDRDIEYRTLFGTWIRAHGIKVYYDCDRLMGPGFVLRAWQGSRFISISDPRRVRLADREAA